MQRGCPRPPAALPFPEPPELGWRQLCRLLPTCKVRLGLRTWAVASCPGVKSAAAGHAGDAHLGTWPSCLVGTCGTHCCSWCRCGADTSRPAGMHSGTGDREECLCRDPGVGSAEAQLPSEPKVWGRLAKALQPQRAHLEKQAYTKL